MLNVIANALRHPSARLIEDGYYQNKNEEWGYHLTVWFAGHYHMISVSHTLEPQSPEDIACALASREAVVYEDGRYPNARGTLGYWATVKSGEHWYMVSVSDMLQPYHDQWWAERTLA
jgi:hypothetical protein